MKAMTFDEWLDEIEVFSSRYERLISDLPDMTFEERNRLLVWLNAAYDVGVEYGENNK
jgi:hypothetical protein